MTIQPDLDYVHLTTDGRATALPGGAAFWGLPEAELSKFGQGWLISESECDRDWQTWEMHPIADEFV